MEIIGGVRDWSGHSGDPVWRLTAIHRDGSADLVMTVNGIRVQALLFEDDVREFMAALQAILAAKKVRPVPAS